MDFQPFDGDTDASVSLPCHRKFFVFRNLNDFIHGDGRINGNSQRADGRNFIITAHIGDVVFTRHVDEIHKQRAIKLFGDAQFREMAAGHTNGWLEAEFAFEYGREETADGGGAVLRVEKGHVEGECAETAVLQRRRHGGMGEIGRAHV